MRSIFKWQQYYFKKQALQTVLALKDSLRITIRIYYTWMNNQISIVIEEKTSHCDVKTQG